MRRVAATGNSSGIKEDDSAIDAAGTAQAALFLPTDDERNIVKTMAGYGISAADIARVIRGGIPADSLTAACADELERGGIEANAKIKETLYSQAVNGNTAALLHWTRQQGGTNPSSAVVSTAELQEWFGDVSRVVIADFERRGIIAKASHGQWPLKRAVSAAMAHYREASAGRAPQVPGGGEADQPDLVTERALLARAQREGQVMKNAVMRGELIPSPVMHAVVGGTLAATRAKLLALPTSAAPLVIGCGSLTEVQGILDGLVHDALIELADGDAVAAEVEGRARAQAARGELDDGSEDEGGPVGSGVAGGAAPAPAKADGKRVGGRAPRRKPGE